jgi:hypothetical protein
MKPALASDTARYPIRFRDGTTGIHVLADDDAQEATTFPGVDSALKLTPEPNRYLDPRAPRVARRVSRQQQRPGPPRSG